MISDDLEILIYKFLKENNVACQLIKRSVKNHLIAKAIILIPECRKSVVLHEDDTIIGYRSCRTQALTQEKFDRVAEIKINIHDSDSLSDLLYWIQGFNPKMPKSEIAQIVIRRLMSLRS